MIGSFSHEFDWKGNPKHSMINKTEHQSKITHLFVKLYFKLVIFNPYF